MIRSVIVLLLLIACSPQVALAAGDPEGERSVVDIRVPPPGAIQQLTLADGSVVYGQVQTFTPPSEIVFRTLAGIVLTVPTTSILDLRIVDGRVVKGSLYPGDSLGTRLFFAPTARSLKKGEGYFGTFAFVLPFVQVGVTDRLSLGGGTPLFFFGDCSGCRPFWFTPKLQVVSTERAQAAVGVIHVTGMDTNFGIAYGVTTLGGSDGAASIGLGYAYSGEGGATILMLGGEKRVSRRTKLITENWIWRGGNGFVSGGVRFLGDRLSTELGLMVPLTSETIVIPMVSFAWKF